MLTYTPKEDELNFSRIFFLCVLLLLLALPLASAQTKIPEEISERLLVCPGSQITKIQKNDLGGGRFLYDIDLLAKDRPYDSVVDFYRNETQKRGWKIFRDVDLGQSYMLMCHDGHYKIDISLLSKEKGIPIRVSMEKQR